MKIARGYWAGHSSFIVAMSPRLPRAARGPKPAEEETVVEDEAV